jgi:hypothetical protein
MIKIVVWVIRKAGITYADFYEGNHVVHGGLVLAAPDAVRKPISRYTQNFTFDAGYGRSDAQHYDGVSELWFDSIDAAMLCFEHPYYRDVIVPDGAKFSDDKRNDFHLAEEEIVGEPPLRGQGLKVMQRLATVEGTDPDAFEEFWKSAHETASSELGSVFGYTRNRPPRETPPMSGVVPAGYSGFWLDGPQDIPSFQAYNARFLEAGVKAGLLDTEQCFFLLCNERRVIDDFVD